MTNHLIDGILPAGRDPAAICLSCEDEKVLTYRDVDRRSAAIAAVLSGLGVQPGDRVAVQVEKSPEALLLYLACVRAGAIFVPLNTAYTPAEIDYFLRDAEPSLAVVDPGRVVSLAPVAKAAGIPHVETLGARGEGSLLSFLRDDAAWTDVRRGPDDLAAILYTSGTTGRSKGAMLSHRNLLSNALTLTGIWGFTDRDVLIHALPIFHTHGLFVATNVAMASGAKMIFRAKFDAREAVALMREATVLMGVPTFYTRLLAEEALSSATTSHMRLFISGSAPLRAEDHQAFEKRTGHAILERYGMTETNMNTSNPLGGARVPGSVGFPLPDVELRIADPESGQLLVGGDIGIIEVRGPNVFGGYWRMPEKTRTEFRPDGFFITGDLGRIDQRGYVWIVGRGKDLVITGGYNVYPKEVEIELDALPGVAESAVIGVPHPDFGEAVVGVVVARKSASLVEADVVKALRERLAAYKVPKRLVVIDELPRNSMAKVQKNVLRDTYADLFSAKAVH